MHNIIDKKFILEKLPLRSEESNKSTFGKILNIAGSQNYPGAAYLSSISALKTGCGYITLASIDEVISIVASMAPEITFKRLNTHNGAISNYNVVDDLQNFDVISLGCGITCGTDISNFIINILKNRTSKQKIVLDADGINILAKCKEHISLENTIITPHPKELSRLLNVEVEEILQNREKYARIASQTYDCITVLKGHNSIITNGDEIFVNPTGTSALAKAGTGDVLTGIIAGLLAQKTDIFNAAILGTFIHGLSGDIAADELTKYCVLATDVIEYIPCAFKEILTEE